MSHKDPKRKPGESDEVYAHRCRHELLLGQVRELGELLDASGIDKGPEVVSLASLAGPPVDTDDAYKIAWYAAAMHRLYDERKRLADFGRHVDLDVRDLRERARLRAMREQQLRVERAWEILRSCGIDLRVKVSCMETTFVSFAYKGETILDEEEVDISMPDAPLAEASRPS